MRSKKKKKNFYYSFKTAEEDRNAHSPYMVTFSS